MARCIVLSKKEISSGMLQKNKWEHMVGSLWVVQYIPVKLICDRRCPTFDGSHFSQRKQSKDDNVTFIEFSSTLRAK